jgi:hypothetical protein
MAYEQVKKPSSSFVPVQKKVSGFAPSASRVQAKDVTAGEQEQMPSLSTPATDANWLMKHPLYKGNQFLQRVVAPASESESLESEESLAQRETVQRQEEGKEFGTPYSLPVQAKLTIGEPGDKYEQEADRVASQVVEQINSPEAAQSTQGQSVQRQEEPVEELQRQPSISNLQRSPLPLEVQREAMPAEEELQAKSILQSREAIAGGEASTDLDTAINRARGGGQSLDAGLQRSMGQAMGADFSGVKVHTDAQSDQLNQTIQAKAFTKGQDVFFRSGAYEPGSRGGQELIAHELTHVVQQNGEGVRRKPLPQQQRSPNRAAEAPSNPGRQSSVQRQSSPVVQRAIEIEGITYEEKDLEQFMKKYGENEKEIISAMNDIANYPRTIQAALADSRRIKVEECYRDEHGVFFEAVAEALEKKVEGGVSIEAASRPELVNRPEEGFRELQIKGLIMCIGIVIEAGDENGEIKAVTGSHFVTPVYIVKGEINTEGKKALLEQVAMTKPYGTLKAKLMHVDYAKEGEQKSGAANEADVALEKIVPILTGAGVSVVEITKGAAERSYRLSADGSGTLT